MRRLFATIIVVGAVIPAVAFATPTTRDTGGATAKVVQKAKAKCQSNACHKRVAHKKKLKIRASCTSLNCKRRVARKAAAKRRREIPPVSALAACIIHHESGGNPTATNGQYHGIAQWSPEAWARHGGRKYASDPLYASYADQVRVLNNGLAKYGCRDWCPFDGC